MDQTHKIAHVKDQTNNNDGSALTGAFQSSLTSEAFSVENTGLIAEPLNEDVTDRVFFIHIQKNDKVSINPPAKAFTNGEKLEMHSMIFCQRGALQALDGQQLNNQMVGYNPPGNTVELVAEEDSTLLVVNLAKASSNNLSFDHDNNFKTRSLTELSWVFRPGKEAKICYLQDEFSFSEDFERDTTFHDRFKLLDFEEGTELKAHLHPTTQFKALLTGHITYQDEFEELEQEHLYAGDIAVVDKYTTYKGDTEKSHMVLMDLSQ